MTTAPAKLALSGDEAADRLLAADPLALLIGMVLDQQIPLERAFKSPFDLKARLGGKLDVGDIAGYDADELSRLFREPPALHRFPAANAKRVQELCRLVVDGYDGQAEKVWTTAASGDELYANIRALPGFGDQKARIFIALLGKQLGVRPPGWEEAAGDYGARGVYKSVADIVDAASLGRVRAYKQELKAASKRT
jgi:uncharacterized HhH-GPD family protein